ncbi:MAG: DUF4156 domain-containing protein [Myxococcota bacterium]|nr:DUF4156 domain-containing protein [Myxococcota bacterium]
MMDRAGVILALPLVLACAKTAPMALTPEGARVWISNGGRVSGCEYLGDFVAGSGPRGTPGAWASNQVRNLAAERGATDVVFDDQASRNVVGRGYRCP